MPTARATSDTFSQGRRHIIKQAETYGRTGAWGQDRSGRLIVHFQDASVVISWLKYKKAIGIEMAQ